MSSVSCLQSQPIAFRLAQEIGGVQGGGQGEAAGEATKASSILLFVTPLPGAGRLTCGEYLNSIWLSLSFFLHLHTSIWPSIGTGEKKSVVCVLVFLLGCFMPAGRPGRSRPPPPPPSHQNHPSSIRGYIPPHLWSEVSSTFLGCRGMVFCAERK